MLERDPKTGLFWPNHDRNAQAWVVGDSEDIPEMMKIVRKYRPHNPAIPSVMIEAGGHVGYWTRKFLPEFDYIYTFEPDPINFVCLTHNVPELNVIKFNAAIGNKRELITTRLNEHENSGSASVVQGKTGFIPVLMIDDLNLPALDFMQLDLEGFELPAIYGAADTISRCSPVISVEIKGHGAKYGFDDKLIVAFLHNYGYVLEAEIRSDSIFVRPSG